MTAKKRNLRDWRPADEHAKGRALLPTDYATSDSNNAHFDAAAEMAEDDLGTTSATVATLATDSFNAVFAGEIPSCGPATVEDGPATVKAPPWAATLQAALYKALPPVGAGSPFAPRDRYDLLRPNLVYAEAFAALQDFMGDYMVHDTRPTARDAAASLKRLSGALAKLASAWDAADIRAKEIVYLTLGAGHADAFAEGKRRSMSFHEAAKQHAAAAKTKLKRDPRVSLHDGLIRRLAALYTSYTGQPVTNSANHMGAHHFIEAVTACIGKYNRPTARTIDRTLARIVREQVNKSSP